MSVHSSICLFPTLAIALAGVPAHAAPATAEAPVPADAAGTEPAEPALTPDPSAELPPTDDSAPAAGPIVHLLNAKPDEDYGPLKLAVYQGSTAQAAPNAIVVTTHYKELCTEPCGVAIDVSERPIFFLVRDGRAISYGFRLSKKTGDVTVMLQRPPRNGILMGGVILTSLLILPAGIPMLIMGKARLEIADGPPSDGQTFKKLKKAKT